MRVTVIHLDLGIGGAERLVVNTCCALQELGYELHIVTSHHDQNHCFEETKIGGRLASHIHVYGDWLPRHIFGRGTAFFSILRMLYLSILVSIYQLFSRHKEHVVFIDGVSAPIPFLKFAGLAVFFYCHFPDKLLCVDRGGPLKRSYRYIVDAIEENTTGCADIIACNSTFTSYEFRLAFKILSQQCIPYILNPTVEDDLLVDDYLIRKKEKNRKGIEFIEGTDVMFLSINRYERAKRIDLALNAIRLLKDRVAGNYKNTHLKVTLVVAGGYDSQVRENKEYLQELKDLAKRLDIQDDVVFRTSISKGEYGTTYIRHPV
jgi:alpha-1,3/alpha-1,6-mannosyltransferase